MLNKGTYRIYQSLVQSYPIGKEGWYAFVGTLMYIRDIRTNSWVTQNKTQIISWGDIQGDITNQTDLIDYISDLGVGKTILDDVITHIDTDIVSLNYDTPQIVIDNNGNLIYK